MAMSAGRGSVCASSIGGLVGAALVLATALCAPAAGADRPVLYLVTYADGSMRCLSAAPRTAEGIAKVLQFPRASHGVEDRQTPSGGATTYTGELEWNGKAWVVPSGRAATAPADGSDRGQRARLLD
ncbi:MAG: hypothetical protein WBF17_15655, partial [Phycisphaerae bacterium]